MQAAAGAGTLSRPDLENWTMRVIDSRVLNIDELKLERFTQGDTFASDAVQIGPLIGAKELGCPTGGPETAHQIINDSDADLAYLSVSTQLPVEVCEYPDSKKIGAYGGGLRHMTRSGDHLDYWTDEA